MFNIEQSISEWRRRMLAAGIQSPVPLEELENHLREEIERQVKSGASEQTAFETASAQIGEADPIQTEFEKFNGTRNSNFTGYSRIYSAISLFCAGTFLFLLLAFPPISRTDEAAYFTFYSHPVQEMSDFYYGLDFSALRDDGQRIDVPVWFVDVSLVVAAIGSRVLALRRRANSITQPPLVHDN